MNRLRRYLPWALAPLLALAVLLVSLPPQRRQTAAFDDARFVRGGNEGRTVRAFAGDDADPSPLRPLYESNREGLRLDIRLDAETWSRMLLPANRGVYTERSTNATVGFGDRPPRPATLRLRGGGSLGMPGKPSFNLRLLHPERFAPDVELKHVYLANMRYDRPGVKTRFGYGLLADLGLFAPYVQFVRVSVNDAPMGTYLLVEPPEHAIRRTHPDCVAVYRRWATNRFERLWSERVPLQDKLIDRLITLGVAEDDDPSVARGYDEVLDVEQFLTWLAVNSAVLNADTTDELFVFETRGAGTTSLPGRLHVMGWDYEDILADKPASDDGIVRDPLLYEFRDTHERHVRRDPALRERLRALLARMIEGELSPDRLVRRLRAAQALRDEMDDADQREGRLTPEAVREAKAARATFVTAAEETLRRRHAQLQLATALPSAQPE